MKIINVLWYGVFGMVIFPYGIVISVLAAGTSDSWWERGTFAMLAVFMFLCGRKSLRKMRENL